MKHISTIIFDFGGVIITIDQQQAIDRFKEIGLADADQRLDSYTQTGIFGALESGEIDGETFRNELEKLTGTPVTHEQCCYAWRGYCKELPQRNLRYLQELRKRGYRVLLLSNTNPLMMEWAMSCEFDGNGNPIQSYFDGLYLSYRCRLMKPSSEIFIKLLHEENLSADEALFVDDGQRNVDIARQLGFNTLCPVNGEDWITPLEQILSTHSNSNRS